MKLAAFRSCARSNTANELMSRNAAIRSSSVSAISTSLRICRRIISRTRKLNSSSLRRRQILIPLTRMWSGLRAMNWPRCVAALGVRRADHRPGSRNYSTDLVTGGMGSMIHFVQQRFGAADVPIGSKAEIGRDKWHAGFGLNSGLLAEIAVRQRRAAILSCSLADDWPIAGHCNRATSFYQRRRAEVGRPDVSVLADGRDY